LKSLSCEAARVIFLTENSGKTAAVRAGLAEASGKWVLIQDADLEYDPKDIKRLLECAGDCGVVYGRRPGCWTMPRRWIFASGVLFIDIAIMLTYGRWLRDHATCYKPVPRRYLLQFDLASTGFEGCIEITAKLMRARIPIQQTFISYAPRSVSEGKKLTLGYGWTALAAVWKYRTWQPRVESETWARETA